MKTEKNVANPAPEIVVIGIGNAWRGDDAAGLLVAHALAARRMRHVRIEERTSIGPELIDAWRGADAVILVDAVVSGAAPGTVHRIDAHRDELPVGLTIGSTHAFDLTAIIDLARALDNLPGQLLIFGIETSSFEPGQAVSPEVLHSLALCTDAIVDEIRRLRRSTA
ncbi:MAG: hydrogenase maturation protease [Caldilineaceae bacterium]|nr:hydrogenase maturation protease [Caldilineaceae bacterium]